MASRGFIELLRLADRGLKRHKGKHIDTQDQWMGMAFTLGGYQLVAPLGDVAEILTMPDVTPVPLAQPWMIGIANVRGRLLPITHLGQFLGLPQPQQRYRNQKLLVIDQSNIYSGLLVDEILGIQSFNRQQYKAVSLPNEEPLAIYTHGHFKKDDSLWYIFMPSLLVENTEFLEAAL